MPTNLDEPADTLQHCESGENTCCGEDYKEGKTTRIWNVRFSMKKENW